MDQIVTVFGGTGFLGRRVVRHLRDREFTVRIVSRHPDRGHRQFGLDDPLLQFVEASIHDERSVAHALAGAYGVVNAVSLYVEHGRETFHAVHVEAAQRVAAQALRAGVERLAHVSGIGAGPKVLRHKAEWTAPRRLGARASRSARTRRLSRAKGAAWL
jgi:uncharacterized protein YbjT (DUF2867 family)